MAHHAQQQAAVAHHASAAAAAPAGAAESAPWARWAALGPRERIRVGWRAGVHGRWI